MALLVVTAANTLTAHWTRRQGAVGVALVLVGAVLAPGTSPDDLLSWALVGLLGGGLLLGAYVWVLRDRPALVVLAAAAMTVPNVLDRGLDQAYGGALVGSLLGTVLVSYIAWRWFVHLSRRGSSRREAVAPGGRLSERVDDAYRTVSLSVREIFGEENLRAKRLGGCDDRAIPVGDPVAERCLDSRHDQRIVRQHERERNSCSNCADRPKFSLRTNSSATFRLRSSSGAADAA